MGTVDQHSQLQLYLGGPADKMFTVLILDTAGQGGRSRRQRRAATRRWPISPASTMGDLLLAEADATAATLAKNGRPTRIIAHRHTRRDGRWAR